jgi:hypothetical protein
MDESVKNQIEWLKWAFICKVIGLLVGSKTRIVIVAWKGGTTALHWLEVSPSRLLRIIVRGSIFGAQIQRQLTIGSW